MATTSSSTPRRRRKTPAGTPDSADIVAAVQALNSQSSTESGIAKHATTIVVAIMLALVLWVGATIMTLNTTVTRMAANVDMLSKSIDGLQAGQGSSTKTIGDLQALTARQDARSDAISADVDRMKERVRMLEGQKPVNMHVSDDR